MTASSSMVSVIRATKRASRVFRRAIEIAALALLVAAIAAGFVVAPFRALVTIWLLNALLMIVVSSLTLSRMLYVWHRPERRSVSPHAFEADPELTFSIIVPARHEPILERTLNRLMSSTYTKIALDVIVVVGDDDPATTAIARRVETRHHNVKVVVDSSPIKSKPRGLEVARPHCTGDLVGIVDAESLVAPLLLAHVNTLALANPQVAVFQGGVQLMNHRATKREPGSKHRGPLKWANGATSWWRARNCVEYYVWFMSRLRYQQHINFVPLGGNTVFIRQEVLTELDGWDEDCLTEDCELGVRASARGFRTLVFYHPDLVTQEETPDSLSALVVQRTRWMTGFMQVLRKGEWKALPWRHRIRAFEMLTMPLFQAYAGFAAILSLVLVFTLRAPVGAVLFTWLPLLVMLVGIAFEHAAYQEFTNMYHLKRSHLDSFRFIICAPFYQLVLSAAAIRAVVRLSLGKLAWEKTTHSGQHLTGTDLDDEADTRELEADEAAVAS